MASLINKFTRIFDINPLYSILILVWFILLGIFGLLRETIAPITIVGPYFLVIGFSILKIIIGIILILLWLISWNKLLKIVIIYEQELGKNENNP